MSTGYLLLEDGTVLRGQSVAADGIAFGEAVFTTAMTGYQEIVTDPSYCGQLVCFTAPMVGNYGVDQARSESGRPHARAVFMREARGPEWTDWLLERGIVALTGIDTRSVPLGRSTTSTRDSCATRASSTMLWQRLKYTSPASVSSTLRVERCSSRRPIAFSSSAM